MLERTLEELAGVLERQADVYDALAVLGEKKKGILVEGRLRELEEVVVAEEVLVRKAARLEEVRGEIVDRLAAGEETSAGVLKVKTLMEQCPEPLSTRFQQVQDRLSQSVERVGSLNRTNGELIRRSLRYIDFSLQVLLGAGGTVTYRAGGRWSGANTGQAARVVDRRL